MSDRVLVDVQIASSVASVPEIAVIRCWIEDTISEIGTERHYEVAVRIVDEEEGRFLNKKYRGKDYATNVLSFPADESLKLRPLDFHVALGDVVICGPVVEREATRQQKNLVDHWAHLLVHGTLHLFGHDHELSAEAQEMESAEKRILGKRGISDPYVA